MNKDFFFTGWITSRSPTYFKKKMSFMTYQLEKGKKKGKKHWQGVVRFVKPVSLDYAKSLFGGGYYLSPCVDIRKAIQYCRKKDSRFEMYVTRGNINL